MKTAMGSQIKDFDRSKHSYVTYRRGQQVLENASVITVPSIGRERKGLVNYINVVCDLFKLSDSIREHMLNSVTKEGSPIHVIIGQRASAQLLEELEAEQLRTCHPWILPNTKIYRNPLTRKLLIAGRAPEVWDRWDRRSRTKSRLVGQIMWDKKDLIGHIVNIKDI